MKSLRWSLILILIGLLVTILFVFNRKLDRQSAQLDHLLTPRGGSAAAEDLLGPAEGHTLADVEKRFSGVGKGASTPDLAGAIAEVDEWMIDPKSSAPVQDLLNLRQSELRQRVLDDVKKIHLLALTAKSGPEAAKAYNDAGSLVALFPMSESPAILEQARDLALAHRIMGMKLEVAKRMRYNRWAVERLEMAIQGYHAKSSFLHAKKENPELMASLVANVGEIDPNQLEPSVLSLYNYAVEMTKDAISEAEKVSLTKSLTAPEIQRKLPDDF